MEVEMQFLGPLVASQPQPPSTRGAGRNASDSKCSGSGIISKKHPDHIRGTELSLSPSEPTQPIGSMKGQRKKYFLG